MTNVAAAAPEPASSSSQQPYPHSLFASLARPCIAPGPAKSDKLRLIFDIETNGLLDTGTKAYCIVVSELDSDRVAEYGPPAAIGCQATQQG
jgi:hypothetical protein